MKSALLLSLRADLFEFVSSTLVQENGQDVREAAGVTQFTDAKGRLFTVFEGEDGLYSEHSDGPCNRTDGGLPLDTRNMSACVIECRWEDLFAQILGSLAEKSQEPLWVLDGNGVIWPAGGIDPTRIQL